jgi:hypothetical protein
MKRSKLYFNTSSYLRLSVLGVLFLMIAHITAFVIAPRNNILFVWFFLALSPGWLIDWIRKRNYFGDIIFKRLKTKRYKVINNFLASYHKVRCMELTVINEETGLKEDFRYYNYYSDGKINEDSNLESIEFTYLAESKLIVEVNDFKLKEKKRKV